MANIKVYYCYRCGNTDVMHEAEAYWNIDKQDWDFHISDSGYDRCWLCDGEGSDSAYYDTEDYRVAVDANLARGALVRLRDTYEPLDYWQDHKKASRLRFADLEDQTGLLIGQPSYRYSDTDNRPWEIQMFNGETVVAWQRDIELIAEAQTTEGDDSWAESSG